MRNKQSFSKQGFTSTISIRDCSRGLIIVNNASNPDHRVDIHADEIILQDDKLNPYRIPNVDLTLDITSIGINGLDDGSERPNTWYYIWVIAKANGNGAGLLSTSSVNPLLPPGYVYKAFAGAVHNCRNCGNDFGPMKQVRKMVARNAVAVINSGTETAATPIDCSGALPEKAVAAAGDMTLNIADGGGRGAGWIRSAPDQGIVEFAGYLDSAGRLTVPFCVPVVESQTLYYNRDGTARAESVTISISGFEF
jgi:hypothetical protein